MGCQSSKSGTPAVYAVGSAGTEANLTEWTVTWEEIDEQEPLVDFDGAVGFENIHRMLSLAGAVIHIQRARIRLTSGLKDEWRIVLSDSLPHPRCISLVTHIASEARARELRYILMTHGVCVLLRPLLQTELPDMNAQAVFAACVRAIGRGRFNPSVIVNTPHGAGLFPNFNLKLVTPWCVSGATLDVLLLPGLQGDSHKTWTEGGLHWVRDCVLHPTTGIFGEPGVRALPWINPERVRVMTVAHDMDFGFQRLDDMTTTCRLLLDSLATARVGLAPLLIISHSLGGLLAKRLLEVAEDEHSHLMVHEKSIGVIFLGTPHNGAAVVAGAGAFGMGAAAAIRFLHPVANQHALQQLNTRFLRRIDVPFVNFQEKLTVRVHPPWLGMVDIPLGARCVVTQEESDIYHAANSLRRPVLDVGGMINRTFIVDKHHFNIASYATPEDEVLGSIKRAIADLVAFAVVPAEVRAAADNMDAFHRAVLQRALPMLSVRAAVYQALQNRPGAGAGNIGTELLLQAGVAVMQRLGAAITIVHNTPALLPLQAIVLIALGVGSLIALQSVGIGAAFGSILGPVGTAAGAAAALGMAATAAFQLRPYRNTATTVAEVMQQRGYEERIAALRRGDVPDDAFVRSVDCLLVDIINEVSLHAIIQGLPARPGRISNNHATRAAIMHMEVDLFARLAAVSAQVALQDGPAPTDASRLIAARATLARQLGADADTLAAQWERFLQRLQGM